MDLSNQVDSIKLATSLMYLIISTPWERAALLFRLYDR